MRKILDNNILSEVSATDPKRIFEEPGMELIIDENLLPKDNIVVESSMIPMKPKELKDKPKKPERPITKESIVDLKNLQDNENPEKLEYNYDVFE